VNVSRCLQPDVADRFVHGRLTGDEFAQALKHAAGCASCRQLLFATSRPAPDVDGSMDQIQERLTAWRAARRAPLMPAFPWPKGHEVDRYVIIRSVGGTEDGVIYEAFDPERDDRVVVKQLDLHIEDPATPALMRVANQLCQLAHPNVLQMLSVGVHAGFVYFVYEFVKGTPLSQAGADGPRHLIALYAEAGLGLAAAHDAGISHGCFSAASCVVGRDGKVKVLDFGVGEARIHRVSATKTVHDQEWTTSNAQVSSDDSFVGFIPPRQRGSTGQFESIVLAAGPNSLGPRLYAAPELVLGEPPSPAADQFAFCAALFHRLYGRPPVDGETISLWLRELLKGQIAVPPASGVPPHVHAALLRGLARDPAARFDRMSTLVGKLGRHRPATSARTRTIAAIAIGATVAVTGLLVAGELRGGAGAGAGTHGEACDQTLVGWNTLWGQRAQDELTRASGTAAADAWPVLRTRLDAWVGSWRQATHGFCDLPVTAASSDCPSRAHAAASDLLQLVKDGAPGRLTLAAAAAEALPTADQCASSAPSAASAPILAVKADVRRRLGMLDEADLLTAKPAEDPAQRSYQSLVRGYTADDRGDLINARRLFEDATFEAQAAHQPELGVTAALSRLALSCSASERALWTGYLDAQAHVTSGKPLPPTELRSALAQSLSCEGKLTEAVQLRREVALALHSDEGPTGAAAALALARAQLAQGDLVSAESVAHIAAGIYTQLYGARHPLAQIARLTVAEAQLGSPGSAAIAAATAEHVLADVADHTEADAVRGRALLLQSRLAEARGSHDEAVHFAQRATSELEASLGGTHPELASALLVAGDLLLVGHEPEAETDYRQVVAIFETLGQTDSAGLAHARAGIELARWGNKVPDDAAQTLQWGLSPSGDAIDPAVAGWIAEQLGRRAAARGEQPAALAQYRAAAAAWQQSGDRRGLGSALTAGALLAAKLHDPDARPMLEQALQAGAGTTFEKPRLQAALAKLLWPTQRERAIALARAALADLPAGSPDAADLTQWLSRHGER
jgi:eukaryotic-like serine/threonine-protein kinase